MRAFEIITESTGGIARRFLEKQSGKDIHFLDAQQKRWDLEDVVFFPADPDLKYESDETATAMQKMQADLDQYLGSNNLTVTKIFGEKSTNTKSVAAMVVVVTDGTKKSAYVRQVKNKQTVGSNAIKWENTEFRDNTGLTVQTPQMKKAGVPIEPADYVVPLTKYSTDQLIDTVINKIESQPLPEELKNGIPLLLQNVIAGKIQAAPNTKQHEPVIQVKLGEIAAPLALTAGKLVSGAYATSNEQLLKPLGGSWTSASGISFPDKGEELVDSYIHLPGGEIGISSKSGKGGAKPSIKSIVDTLTEKSDSFTTDFLNSHNDIIEDLKVLYEQSAISGVMTLAAKKEIINKEDINYISSVYGKGNVNPSGMTDNLRNLLASSSYQKVDKDNPEYQLGYHILAVIAREVANSFNRDKNRITEFFKAVLNKANMVQVLAKTVTQGDGVAYRTFEVIWPAVFDGAIQTTGTHYTSRTRPTRKISFEFK